MRPWMVLSLLLTACGGAEGGLDSGGASPDMPLPVDAATADVPAADVPEVAPDIAPQPDAGDPADPGDTASVTDESAPEPIDAGVCEPTTIASVAAVPMTGVPCGTWAEASDGPLGPDGFAELTGASGTTCLVGDLPLPQGSWPVTLEWLDSAETAIQHDRNIVLGPTLLATLAPGPAYLPLYSHAVIETEPGLAAPKLQICASAAQPGEVWRLDDLVVLPGLPPTLGGSAYPPPPETLTVAVGEKKVLTVTCKDPDVQQDPYVEFVTYSLWDAPTFVTWTKGSSDWDWLPEVFHNYLVFAPQQGDSGTYTFSVICTDGQGLHANAWITLTVPSL